MMHESFAKEISHTFAESLQRALDAESASRRRRRKVAPFLTTTPTGRLQDPTSIGLSELVRHGLIQEPVKATTAIRNNTTAAIHNSTNRTKRAGRLKRKDTRRIRSASAGTSLRGQSQSKSVHFQTNPDQYAQDDMAIEFHALEEQRARDDAEMIRVHSQLLSPPHKSVELLAKLSLHPRMNTQRYTDIDHSTVSTEPSKTLNDKINAIYDTIPTRHTNQMFTTPIRNHPPKYSTQFNHAQSYSNNYTKPRNQSLSEDETHVSQSHVPSKNETLLTWQQPAAELPYNHRIKSQRQQVAESLYNQRNKSQRQQAAELPYNQGNVSHGHQAAELPYNQGNVSQGQSMNEKSFLNTTESQDNGFGSTLNEHEQISTVIEPESDEFHLLESYKSPFKQPLYTSIRSLNQDQSTLSEIDWDIMSSENRKPVDSSLHSRFHTHHPMENEQTKSWRHTVLSKSPPKEISPPYTYSASHHTQVHARMPISKEAHTSWEKMHSPPKQKRTSIPNIVPTEIPVLNTSVEYTERDPAFENLLGLYERPRAHVTDLTLSEHDSQSNILSKQIYSDECPISYAVHANNNTQRSDIHGNDHTQQSHTETHMAQLSPTLLRIQNELQLQSERIGRLDALLRTHGAKHSILATQEDPAFADPTFVTKNHLTDAKANINDHKYENKDSFSTRVAHTVDSLRQLETHGEILANRIAQQSEQYEKMFEEGIHRGIQLGLSHAVNLVHSKDEIVDENHHQTNHQLNRQDRKKIVSQYAVPSGQSNASPPNTEFIQTSFQGAQTNNPTANNSVQQKMMDLERSNKYKHDSNMDISKEDKIRLAYDDADLDEYGESFSFLRSPNRSQITEKLSNPHGSHTLQPKLHIVPDGKPRESTVTNVQLKESVPNANGLRKPNQINAESLHHSNFNRTSTADNHSHMTTNDSNDSNNARAISEWNTRLASSTYHFSSQFSPTRHRGSSQ